MSKTILVTVSDDRAGRKGGLYEATQQKVMNIFHRNGFIDNHFPWSITHLTLAHPIINGNNYQFYQENKVMLDCIDPAINGRLYKPYAIWASLEEMAFGDYLIYNDVSPEIWKEPEDFIIEAKEFDINIIKNLCDQARGILASFVKWSPDNFRQVPLGFHTHHFFTTEECIKEMKSEKHRNSFQCASGMLVIKKTDETIDIIKSWLEYNRNWKCSALGNPAIPGDESLWHNRPAYKLGCRHDQSILSILLNKLDWSFVDIHYNDMNPYNFLNFCRVGFPYYFIQSTSPFTIKKVL